MGRADWLGLFWVWFGFGIFAVITAWGACALQIKETKKQPENRDAAYYALLLKYAAIAVSILFFPSAAVCLALLVVCILGAGIICGADFLMRKHRERFDHHWEAMHAPTAAEPTLLRPCDPVSDTDTLLRVVGQD